MLLALANYELYVLLRFVDRVFTENRLFFLFSDKQYVLPTHLKLSIFLKNWLKTLEKLVKNFRNTQFDAILSPIAKNKNHGSLSNFYRNLFKKPLMAFYFGTDNRQNT
jgi:hypothetical protein